MSNPFRAAEAAPSWERVIGVLSGQGPGTRLCINKWNMPHPATVGLYPVIYPPMGQVATYYKLITPVLGFLVIDFTTHYDCQLDHRPLPLPTTAVQTMPVPAPVPGAEALIAGGTALGAALGASLGKTQKSVATGALLGAALAALIAANKNNP